MLTMVVTNPNLQYGSFEAHTCTNYISPFAQLTHLPHDGFMNNVMIY
jgi:hypothetical protein